MSAQELITDHLDLWTGAVTTRSAAGRGRHGKIELTGIKKLRELILELAVRGKLVEQDPSDKPASVLLERVIAERNRLKQAEGMRTNASENIAPEDKYINIPQSWEIVRLGNAAKFVDYRGKTPKKVEIGKRLITAKNIRKGYIDKHPEEFISESDYQAWMTRGFPRKGDTLFTTEAPLGNAANVDLDEEFALAQRAICFQWHIEETSSFMLLQILSPPFQEQLVLNANGMTATGIKAAKLKEISVALPPLEEQLRIVEKVDELMALCDRLEQHVGDQLEAHEVLVDTLLDALTRSADAAEVDENWARLAEHFDTLFTTEASIDKLKQAILQLAVMGRLVEQDTNDEPASVLLERIAEEKTRLVKEGRIKKPKIYSYVTFREKVFSVHSSWKWIRLGELLEAYRDISYGIIKLEKEPSTGGIPTLRCSDVKPGHIDISAVRNVSEEIELPYSRTRLKGGEVLLNIRGTLGGVGLATSNLAGFNIAREVAMIPFHKSLSGRHMVILISSPYFWSMIEENLKGIAYKGLSLKTLREMPIPLPPENEQHRIVEKVDELMALCDRLKACLGEAGETRTHLAEAVVEQAVS